MYVKYRENVSCQQIAIMYVFDLKMKYLYRIVSEINIKTLHLALVFCF